jgi:polysaccharide export outer membrane protein
MADVPAGKAPAAGLISPGDTLRLTFRKLPELNQTQRVRPDGRVSLLQVGSVKAAGKSLDSFQRDLADRYELKSAGDLSVSMEDTHLAVYVTGAVGRPGKIVLDRPMTVLEAIMESGGFDRTTANLKKVSLTRSVNGRYVTKWMDLRDPSAGGEYVQPYDMIEIGRYFQ